VGSARKAAACKLLNDFSYGGITTAMPHAPSCLLLAALAAGTLAAADAAAQAATTVDYVATEALRSAAEQAALMELRNAEFARDATRLEASAGALDSRLRFEACAEPMHVDVDLDRPTSRINARLSCAGPMPWALYVPLEIRVFRQVVTTTRPMARGEAIGEADVTLAERDVMGANSPVLMSLEDAIGRQLRRNLQANGAVAVNAVEWPLMVRRGDRVSLSSNAGGITVTATGEALGNGRSGERIRVRNLQSARVVDATVTGPGSAEVI